MNHEKTERSSADDTKLRDPPVQDEDVAAAPKWRDIATALERGAELAAEIETPLEVFMNLAFASFVAAHPELREQIEREQTLAQMENLRRRGQLALA